MIYIFPDTNIFLHYRSFDELDWLPFAGLGEKEATLVVAFAVVHELDDHKRRHGGPRSRRKRAGEVSGRLWKYLESGNPALLPTGTHLQSPSGEPTIDFEAHGLTKDNQDDQILATVIQFKQENQDAKVCIVSADTGIKLKAKMRGIDVASPPEDRLLPLEVDEVEKENLRLKRELDQLKSRTPRLSIAFANGDDKIAVWLEPVEPVPEVTINRRLARIRSWFKVTSTPEAGMPIRIIGDPTSEMDWETYRKDVGHYVEAFEAYVRASSEAMVARSMSFSVQIVIRNDGNAPAKNVDVYLEPQNGAQIAGKLFLPDTPSVPKRPRPERKLIGLEAIRSPLSDFPSVLDIDEYDLEPLGLGDPRIVGGERRNGDPLKVHIPVLKHGEVAPFPDVHLSFDDAESIKNFHIGVRITSDTMLKPETTELHVVVEAAPAVPCPKIPDPEDQ